MDNKLKTLAQRVASSHHALETKERMLQHLLDGKPSFYVEAELEFPDGTIFVGFKPTPTASLSEYVTGGAFVVPRVELPTDEKALQYINILRRLKGIAELTQTRTRFFSKRTTLWRDTNHEIVWYSYFDDEVSLRDICSLSTYIVVSRKELLDGPFNTRLSGQGICGDRLQRQGRHEELYIQGS